MLPGRWNVDCSAQAIFFAPGVLTRHYCRCLHSPSTKPMSTCDVIHSAIAYLQTQHPSAFIAISGDFNHVIMATTSPNFTQYWNCLTREERTLDLLYANTKDAYSCSPLPPPGGSDHNLVHPNPCYVPLVRSQPQKQCGDGHRRHKRHCGVKLRWQTGRHSASRMGRTLIYSQSVSRTISFSVWTPLSQFGLSIVIQITSHR